MLAAVDRREHVSSRTRGSATEVNPHERQPEAHRLAALQQKYDNFKNSLNDLRVKIKLGFCSRRWSSDDDAFNTSSKRLRSGRYPDGRRSVRRFRVGGLG